MAENEKYVSIRECEIRTENVCKLLENLTERVEKIENRFWWIITLLVSNLAGILLIFIKGVIK